MCEIFHAADILQWCPATLSDQDTVCSGRKRDIHILVPLLHTTTIERDSKQAITTTLQRNTDTPACLFQALMSRRTTRQPHPHMLPFAYAPRLRSNPRFVVALVHHSGKQVYACLARRSTVRSQMRWRCSICASPKCS